jgi:hypothetical protein
MGSMSYEALYVDDTVLWDPVNGISLTFTGVHVAFYEPGGRPSRCFRSMSTPHPRSTVSSCLMARARRIFRGRTRRRDRRSVSFVANPPAPLARSIAIDFVFPAGCFSTGDQQLIARVCEIRLIAEYAPVNDASAITDPFTV